MISKIDRLTTDGKLPAVDSWVDHVCTQVERALNITVTPPLQARRTPTGIQLACAVPPAARLAKSASGGIGGMSGSTPGSGNIVLYDFDGTDVTSETIEDQAFNLSTTGIDADKWLIVNRVGKYWFVTVEGCEAGG